jgi:hypothetical protein
MVFVSLTAFVLMASAQLPTTWTNPYYFYSNINTPPIVAPQKISADETEINSKTFTNYDDHSIQNTLSSHVVLLTACLRDLKSKLYIFSGKEIKFKVLIFSYKIRFGWNAHYRRICKEGIEK